MWPRSWHWRYVEGFMGGGIILESDPHFLSFSCDTIRATMICELWDLVHLSEIWFCKRNHTATPVPDVVAGHYFYTIEHTSAGQGDCQLSCCMASEALSGSPLQLSCKHLTIVCMKFRSPWIKSSTAALLRILRIAINRQWKSKLHSCYGHQVNRTSITLYSILANRYDCGHSRKCDIQQARVYSTKGIW